VLASSLSDDRFLEASDEERRWVRESARLLAPADWLRLFDLWSKESDRILRSEYPLLLFEISVVLAASLPAMTDLRSLLDTLRDAPATLPRSPEPPSAIKSEPPKTAPKVTRPTVRTAEPAPAPVPTPPPPKDEPTAPPAVTGWRDFVERLAQEEPMTGGALKTVTALERAGTVTVQIPQATKALLDPKKEMLAARFAELTGGRKLRFADEVSEGTSVAQQETKEGKEKNAKIREEVRNDPVVKRTEQTGLDFKKASPT